MKSYLQIYTFSPSSILLYTTFSSVHSLQLHGDFFVLFMSATKSEQLFATALKGPSPC